MSGSIKKTGRGYQIRWDAGTKANGKRHQRSATLPTKREAEAALAENVTDVRNGKIVNSTKVKVGDYLESWLTGMRHVRPTTRRSYDGHIKFYLKPLIGSIPLTGLTAAHLDHMYSEIRAGRVGRLPSAATQARVHATLRKALNDAVKRRLISFNPAVQVSLDSVPRPSRTIWTVAQLLHFLRSSSSDRLGPAYFVLAMTGLRRGELCGLRWCDLDLPNRSMTISRQHIDNGGKVVVGEPKTKRGRRTLALTKETVEVLKTHRSAQNAERLVAGPSYRDHDLVFANEIGEPLRPEHVTRHFQLLASKANLPKITLHGLRHTYASHAIAAGAPIGDVSRNLGHSSISFTFDTYTHGSFDQSREVADRLAALYRGAESEGA